MSWTRRCVSSTRFVVSSAADDEQSWWRTLWPATSPVQTVRRANTSNEQQLNWASCDCQSVDVEPAEYKQKPCSGRLDCKQPKLANSEHFNNERRRSIGIVFGLDDDDDDNDVTRRWAIQVLCTQSCAGRGWVRRQDVWSLVLSRSFWFSLYCMARKRGICNGNYVCLSVRLSLRLSHSDLCQTAKLVIRVLLLNAKSHPIILVFRTKTIATKLQWDHIVFVTLNARSKSFKVKMTRWWLRWLPRWRNG